MASFRKNTKLLTRILPLLVLAIWGEIAYQLFLHRKASSDMVPVASASSVIGRSEKRAPYEFNGNVRDPFAYISRAAPFKERMKLVPRILHIWTPPRVSLEGVMLGGGKRTAILTDASGQTHFLSRGDTLDGVRILEVNDRIVTYNYNRKDTSWIVERR